MALCAAGRTQRICSTVFLPPSVPVTPIYLPLFLCPALLAPRFVRTRTACLGSSVKPSKAQNYFSTRRVLQAQTFTTSSSAVDSRAPPPDLRQRELPLQCGGCGALTQSVKQEDPGFYTSTRATVKRWLENRTTTDDGKAPVCDRCHHLLHHSSGTSIQHPNIDELQDIVADSPHKYNHIYHVVDAADFPMSLIPGIHRLLNATPQRSKNRRSKSSSFSHGKKIDLSFIITRSDLLAPLKEQVDGLMPYLVEVLRDALGSHGRNVRLGNVSCVSAKRAWWTSQLKEAVWKRGGAGWMVGKVNVGKSQLFECIFPKGRRGTPKFEGQLVFEASEHKRVQLPQTTQDTTSPNLVLLPVQTAALDEIEEELRRLNNESLLPPLQPETDYPAMPLVSSLPGTTASPIRIPYGNGRGELIDLPGLSRGDLEEQVLPAFRSSLVMRSRPQPEQRTIKPGQSLLLGGFIRITPLTDDLVVLAYNFTTLNAHVTSTERKAVAIQTGTDLAYDEGNGNLTLNRSNSGTGNDVCSANNTSATALPSIDPRTNIATPTARQNVRSAGVFALKWDVTKKRSGALTRKDAVGLKPERLPYVVLSADVLIEGCGWVELVVQVRRRALEDGVGVALAKAAAAEESMKASALSASSSGTVMATGITTATYTPLLPSQPQQPNSQKHTPTNNTTKATHATTPQEPFPPLLSTSTLPSPSASASASPPQAQTTPQIPYPEIEIFTPEGGFISIRPPMGAWLLNEKPINAGGRGRVGTSTSGGSFAKAKVHARPRRSLKGAKKMGKMRAREGL